MKRKTKKSAAQKEVILFTLILAIVLVLTVSVGEKASERFGWKIDITSTGMYKLSDSTQAVLEGLHNRIEIDVAADQEDYPQELVQVLNNYRNASNQITLQFVNLYKNPSFAAQFENYGITPEENNIILRSAYGVRAIPMTDMYTLLSDGYTVESFHAEQQLTSAIYSLNKEKLPVVTFTQGHNEQVGTKLQELFKNDGYRTELVTLSFGDASEEATTMVICAPTVDFLDSELQKLDQFIAEGKSILIFLDPSAPKLPNLEGFLSEWGISVQDELVMEPQNNINSNPTYLVANYAKHEITSYFSQNQYYTVLPISKALNLAFSYQNGISLNSVLVSGKNSYGKTGDTAATEHLNRDASGPFVLAAAAEKTVSTQTGEKTARLFATCCKNIYADDILEQSSYGNHRFLLQTVSWLDKSNSSNLLDIPEKTVHASALVIPSTISLIWNVIFVIGIPLATMAIGFHVWKKRRRL